MGRAGNQFLGQVHVAKIQSSVEAAGGPKARHLSAAWLIFDTEAAVCIINLHICCSRQFHCPALCIPCSGFDLGGLTLNATRDDRMSREGPKCSSNFLRCHLCAKPEDSGCSSTPFEVWVTFLSPESLRRFDVLEHPYLLFRCVRVEIHTCARKSCSTT